MANLWLCSVKTPPELTLNTLMDLSSAVTVTTVAASLVAMTWVIFGSFKLSTLGFRRSPFFLSEMISTESSESFRESPVWPSSSIRRLLDGRIASPLTSDGPFSSMASSTSGRGHWLRSEPSLRLKELMAGPAADSKNGCCWSTGCTQHSL